MLKLAYISLFILTVSCSGSDGPVDGGAPDAEPQEQPGAIPLEGMPFARAEIPLPEGPETVRRDIIVAVNGAGLDFCDGEPDSYRPSEPVCVTAHRDYISLKEWVMKIRGVEAARGTFGR